jgi:hypothetical protein
MHSLSQKTVEHADSGFREQRAEKNTKLPKFHGRTCGVYTASLCMAILTGIKN